MNFIPHKYTLKKNLLIMPPSIFIKEGTVCYFMGCLSANPTPQAAKLFLFTTIENSSEDFSIETTPLYGPNIEDYYKWMEEYFQDIA